MGKEVIWFDLLAYNMENVTYNIYYGNFKSRR